MGNTAVILPRGGIITDAEFTQKLFEKRAVYQRILNPTTQLIAGHLGMSYGVKLTLFLLAFNILGFAEGYLLHELGLEWLVPIILLTALGAVPLSRRWLRRGSR